MKKFLSLVLALVMTMSLVTISAGAKEFTDDENITYDEAVNVISEIGVVDGYADGKFNPTNTLTRQAAAKIICNLILGPTTAAELHADTAPYSDVPITSEFAGYIAYCAKENIISGYADGTFKPGNTLTGYAFMKMLLGALGYDQEIEGYTGPNWSIPVAKRALDIGLNNSLEGSFNGVKAVTREEACLYAFNALQADLVEYETSLTVNNSGNLTGLSIAKARTFQNSATRRTNIKADNIIQFAEQYFTKLVLTEDVDVFGRPDREWEYDGKEIGTYVNYDLLVAEYTEEVTGVDLYNLLGKSTIDDYDTTVYVDGLQNTVANKTVLDDAYFTAAEMNKNNNTTVGATGNGVLTQVFVDSDADVKEITIAIINTYLAIADSDYNEKKEEASFDVYGLEKVGDEYVKVIDSVKNSVDDSEPMTASADDFDVADVAEDDAYLVCVAEGEIQIMTPAEVVEDTEITAFKKESSVTVDGTKYDYADTAEYDYEVLDKYTSTTTGTVNLKDVTYNVYLDAYGYAIGVDIVEDVDNYVFITGIDLKSSSLGNKTAEAGAIFIDGTMDVIDVNMTKSTLDTTAPTALINSWCTYTVNNDGVYTLTEVADATGNAANVPGGSANSKKIAQAHETFTADADIDKKNISLSGGPASGEYTRVYGNDSSVYLTVELAEIIDNSTHYGIIDDVATVTTGVKNANLKVWSTTNAQKEAEDAKVGNTTDMVTTPSVNFAQGVYTLYKNNGYVIAAVVVGEDSAASKNLVYVHSSSVDQESYDKTTDEWTWTRKVVYQGEEITLTEVSDSSTYLEGMNRWTWYQVKLNAEGEVIGVEPASTALTNSVTAGTADAGEYITESIDIAPSVNKYDTVLYHEGIQHSKPSLKGSTLYARHTDDSGFFVDENVKIVLTEYVKNDRETTFETGVDKLEDIIKTLNQKHDDGTYNYTISAILEEGAAVVVVINDESNSYDAPAVVKDVEVNLSATNTTIRYYGTANKPTEDEAIDLIEAELADQGYSVTSRSYDGTNTYTWQVEDARGFERTVKFVWDSGLVQLFKVTLKSSDTSVASGATVAPATQYVANSEDIDFELTVVASGINWGASPRTITLTPASGTAVTTTATGTQTSNVLSVSVTSASLSGDVEYTISWT